MDYDTKLKIGTMLINDLAQDVYTVDTVECTHEYGFVQVTVRGWSLVSEFEIRHAMRASEFVRLMGEL